MAIRKASTPRKAIKPKSKKKAVKKAAPNQLQGTFEEMEKLFDDYFSSGWLSRFHVGGIKFPKTLSPFKGKTPSVDMIERNKEIVVKAKLPGVDKKDIDVSVTHNTVTIKAETSSEEKEEKGDYYHREISHGSYARSLLLPVEVDENNTKAKFSNGILTLTLKKTQKPNRQTVKIQ